jgi:hypothetical protein
MGLFKKLRLDHVVHSGDVWAGSKSRPSPYFCKRAYFILEAGTIPWLYRDCIQQTHTYIYTYVHTYHTYIHTFIHSYIHTYIHTYSAFLADRIWTNYFLLITAIQDFFADPWAWEFYLHADRIWDVQIIYERTKHTYSIQTCTTGTYVYLFIRMICLQENGCWECT